MKYVGVEVPRDCLPTLDNPLLRDRGSSNLPRVKFFRKSKRIKMVLFKGHWMIKIKSNDLSLGCLTVRGQPGGSVIAQQGILEVTEVVESLRLVEDGSHLAWIPALVKRRRSGDE